MSHAAITCCVYEDAIHFLETNSDLCERSKTMKKILTAMLTTAMIAGSSAAMAANYANTYSDLPEWAENAFLGSE